MSVSQVTISTVSGLVGMFGMSATALLSQVDLTGADKLLALGSMGTITVVAIGLWLRSEWLRDRDTKAANTLLVTTIAAHEARYTSLMNDMKAERDNTQKSLVTALMIGFEKLVVRMDANTVEVKENTNALKMQSSNKEVVDQVMKLFDERKQML